MYQAFQKTWVRLLKRFHVDVIMMLQNHMADTFSLAIISVNLRRLKQSIVRLTTIKFIFVFYHS